MAKNEHIAHSSLLDQCVTVLVIGAGGTGSQIVSGLARLHTALIGLGHPGGLARRQLL
jgi:hypothetical protein